MRGSMQDHPLLISNILKHASQNHPNAGLITAQGDGQFVRHTYPELAARSAQLANALRKLGIAPGDRVASLGWNDHAHFEFYYAVSGIGAICHTINPRLFADQLIYIIRHAEDRWIFIDASLLAVLEPVANDIKDILDGIVVFGDHIPETSLSTTFNIIAYEDLIANEPTIIDWPELDETTACTLCYTSGTTGNPKGVLYTHRSTVLHAWSLALPDAVGLRATDVILPIVPMFHVNAWGVPYAAPLVGATIAMPQRFLDGASLFTLIHDAKVTYAAGVPTIWLALDQYLKKTGGKLPQNMRGLVGGAALPESLATTFLDAHGITLDHAWGMTEMSPLGTYNSRKPENAHLSPSDYIAALIQKQGRPPFGVEMKLIDDDGATLAHDGETRGELCVRGPWITAGYFKVDQAINDAAMTPDGWFKTGDVVTIDPSGYMHIVDRSKDLIKSGGEWISSIELENLALGIPGVAEAAAIPATHPKWDERPLLIVVKEENYNLTEEVIRDHLATHLKQWMLPDAVVFVSSLPHTATGKILKRSLRDDYASYLIDNDLVK